MPKKKTTNGTRRRIKSRALFVARQEMPPHPARWPPPQNAALGSAPPFGRKGRNLEGVWRRTKAWKTCLVRSRKRTRER